jgi:hypothetical protein
MRRKISILVVLIVMIVCVTASAYASFPTNTNNGEKEYRITVKSAINNNITYMDKGSAKSMTLPKTIRYYYNGIRQDYDNIKNLLHVNTSIVFEYNIEGTQFEYATILDPIYSSPEVAINFKPSQKKLGEIQFDDKTPIIKGGEIISISEISEKDVVYEVTDNWGNNRYILVVDNKAEGVITNIFPNKLSPKTIQIDNVDYELSEDMVFSKINDSGGAFKIGDRVSALLDYNGMVVDMYRLIYKSGPSTECVVLGNPTTSERLTGVQVLTDKGIFYNESKLSLQLGKKYELVIDGDAIVNVGKTLNQTKSIIVKSILENVVYYSSGEEVKSLILPDKTLYYHNGSVQSYDNVINTLKVNSTIIFADNERRTGYEYAVIIDPVYSKPEIISEGVSEGSTLGAIEFTAGVPIVRSSDGELISTSQIVQQDVVYDVRDIAGEYRYILVLDNKVNGTIKSILPNKLSPKTITFTNGKSYEISKDIDYNKLHGGLPGFKVGYPITLSLGYDGKVVDMN